MKAANVGQEAHAEGKKHHKGHRKAPAQYQLKPKVVEELPQTDPMNIWNGYAGTVRIAGMCFRVTKKVAGEHEIKAVYILEAPMGTELYGLAGSSMYLTPGQIRASVLKSNFSEGSPLQGRQQRAWNFFHKLFVDLGVKKVYVPRPPKPATVAKKAQPSVSVESLLLKTLGKYSFESGAPRVVFELKVAPHFHKGPTQKENALLVELVSVDVGHPLCEYARVGTRLPFEMLFRPKAPDFKGDWAGSKWKVWEFLTDIIAAHQAQKVRYFGSA